MGAATARMFAREGAKVVVADVLKREGRQVAEAIGAAVRFELLGVTKEEGWAAVVGATTRKLDVLVNNARANSVHPGVMPPMRTSGRTADPAVRTERMRFIPMRRPGEVDEVAYAILFLASDEPSDITGSEIHVDGGAITT